jgi:hypothetical protein
MDGLHLKANQSEFSMLFVLLAYAHGDGAVKSQVNTVYESLRMIWIKMQ